MAIKKLVTLAAAPLGIKEVHDLQREVFEFAEAATDPIRICLYFRTGGGKTFSALGAVWLRNRERIESQEEPLEVLVVAPPSTHEGWQRGADVLGFNLTIISHNKFRHKAFKPKRNVPVIVDEFHMLGRTSGVGWKKFHQLSRGLKSDVLILSATPQYNDADRVYCVMKILDPQRFKGGYLDFLYKNCILSPAIYGTAPEVTGFLHHKDAEAYLMSFDQVFRMPELYEAKVADQTVYTDHIARSAWVPWNMFHIHPYKHRVAASDMERRQAEEVFLRVTAKGYLSPELKEHLIQIVGDSQSERVVVFAKSIQVAKAAHQSFEEESILITGEDTTITKQEKLEKFLAASPDELPMLICTAALGTGTDGLDKVCDLMILLHDTDDTAFRKQLMGRILPRGEVDYEAAAKKEFVRIRVEHISNAP